MPICLSSTDDSLSIDGMHLTYTAAAETANQISAWVDRRDVACHSTCAIRINTAAVFNSKGTQREQKSQSSLERAHELVCV